jgi:hypothetical protein
MSQPSFLNYCRWNSATGGVGAFVVGSAAAADQAGAHDVPANCSVIDGKVYRYYAQSPDGTQTELGRGTFNLGLNQLVRTTVIANSDGSLVPLNFLTAPIVDMFPSPVVSVETVAAFLPGTNMVFQNPTAPVLWTRYTGYGDRALRITDTAPSFGGSTGFSSWMTQTVVGNHTITSGEFASHNHTDNEPVNTSNFAPIGCGITIYGTGATGTGGAGGGGAHNHSINMSLAYADFITAQKN